MSHKTVQSSGGSSLRNGSIDLPDLTDTLQRDKRRHAGRGSFGIVYRCVCSRNGEVAVKGTVLPDALSPTEKEEFIRKRRRELGIWRRLDHPNIVPLLGETRGEDFGFDHPCMVAVWMSHGTLTDFITRGKTKPSLPSRIQLIKGSVAGLEYLHSQHIVHGDFHPGNIMIDDSHNARLIDFGFSQTLSRAGDQFSYLWTDSVHPGAAMWAAPELLYPKLYPDLKFEATLHGDIYSLGSIILFILAGKFPWSSRSELECKLMEFKNPPRPAWPVIPDNVWDFIERCWSPRRPGNRPIAQEALAFCREKLEQWFQPNPKSDINVVLFGPLGCGKSSIINLLSKKPAAEVSTDVDPCTKQPSRHEIFIGGRRCWLWDTMGFRLAHGENNHRLSPYRQALSLLRNLTNGVNLILLCVHKDAIFPSLGGLYWMINDFFYAGRAPVAFVVTQFDTPDEGWWERNQDTITQRTGIPVQSIPHECITTLQTGCERSEQALKALLASTITPITLRLDFSSPLASKLASCCGLSNTEAAALADQFSEPSFNVVIFGESGVGKSSVINLIAGHTIAKVGSGLSTCTMNFDPYRICTEVQQFVVWDTMSFNGTVAGRSMCGRAIENAVELLVEMNRQGGVDLLVFCRREGTFTPSEKYTFRLMEEFLLQAQVPVAVVVTHLECHGEMVKWWEENGESMVKALGRDVIGHACITSLDNPQALQDNPTLQKKLSDSKLSVQAMLEKCVAHIGTVARVDRSLAKPSLTRTSKEMGRTPSQMTVENLIERCGLTKKQAEALIQLYRSRLSN